MVCIKTVMHIMDNPVVRTPRRRREHSDAFKRELVARSLEPGASVAAVAMDHGINANLLFGWRRKHLDTLPQGSGAAVCPPAAVLLPVSVEAAPADRSSAPSTPVARPAGGTIEIEIAGARVRLRGSVDEAGLRLVLTTLRELA